MKTLVPRIAWAVRFNLALFAIAAFVFSGTALVADEQPGAASPPARDYRFDGKISREVLENFLSRSVSFTELLHDDLGQPRNRRGVDPRDNIRFIANTGAKFVGRALMCWGRERELDTLLRNAKAFAAELHKADPDIVLQGAAFEIVTSGVETVAIPDYVLKEFNQPLTKRNFSLDGIRYPTGTHRMGNGMIPDMNQIEARMWFYLLCTQYIDAGIEAIHFGQIGLMDQNDRKHVGWLDMLGRVRRRLKSSGEIQYIQPGGPGGRIYFLANALELKSAPTLCSEKLGAEEAQGSATKGATQPPTTRRRGPRPHWKSH